MQQHASRRWPRRRGVATRSRPAGSLPIAAAASRRHGRRSAPRPSGRGARPAPSGGSAAGNRWSRTSIADCESVPGIANDVAERLARAAPRAAPRAIDDQQTTTPSTHQRRCAEKRRGARAAARRSASATAAAPPAGSGPTPRVNHAMCSSDMVWVVTISSVEPSTWWMHHLDRLARARDRARPTMSTVSSTSTRS